MARQYEPPKYGRLISPQAWDSALWLDKSVGVTFKVWSSETGNALAIVECAVRPQSLGATVHVHYGEDEISFVIDGDLTMQLGEQIILAPEGTMLFKPRGIPHAFWNQTRRPARLLQIFTPGGFERYFEEAAALSSDESALAALAEKYRIELQPETVSALVRRHRLRPAVRPMAA